MADSYWGDQEKKYSNDSAAYAAEQKRVNDVISAREKAGLDTSDQKAYQANLNKLGSGVSGQSIEDSSTYSPHAERTFIDKKTGKITEGVINKDTRKTSMRTLHDPTIPVEEPLVNQNQSAFNQQEYFNQLYNMKKAGLDTSHTSALANLVEALNSGLFDLAKESTDASRDYIDQQKGINQNVYQNQQQAKVLGNQRGILNSAQQAGMENMNRRAGMEMNNENMTKRDQRIADIKARISKLKQSNTNAINTENATYGSKLNEAQYQSFLDADQRGLQERAYQDSRSDRYENRGWMLEDATTAYNRDISKMTKQQEFNVANMVRQFGYDMDKMSQQQANTIMNMARNYNYDMAKMRQDVKNYAKKAGIDMDNKQELYEWESDKDKQAAIFGSYLEAMQNSENFNPDVMGTAGLFSGYKPNQEQFKFTTDTYRQMGYTQEQIQDMMGITAEQYDMYRQIAEKSSIPYGDAGSEAMMNSGTIPLPTYTKWHIPQAENPYKSIGAPISLGYPDVSGLFEQYND